MKLLSRPVLQFGVNFKVFLAFFMPPALPIETRKNARGVVLCVKQGGCENLYPLLVELNKGRGFQFFPGLRKSCHSYDTQ